MRNRPAVAAGLLQATSLPFVVTASEVGVALGTITPVTGAALVSAGLLSVIIFPLVALSVPRGGDDITITPSVPDRPVPVTVATGGDPR